MELDIMNKSIGHIIALLVIIVWGTTFVSSKVLLNHGMMPADIFAIRFFLAYILISCISHNRLWADNMRDELSMVGLGVMGGTLYFLTENYALLYGNTSNVAILVCSTPILTALIVGIFYHQERLNTRQWLGTLIAFVGMAMVVFNGEFILRLNPLGDILAIGASLTWAIYSLLMRIVMNRYSIEFVTRKVFAYGFLGILPVIAFESNPAMSHPESLVNSPIVILNLLFLAIVASSGCFLLWNWALKKIGTVRATNYIYLQSIVTMIAAWAILDERITWMAILGTGVLIAGMVLVQK